MSNLSWITITIIIAVALCLMARRIGRTICIARHGWPPPHVDADGDIVECECDAEERLVRR
jgi:hypothetical protein